MMGIAVEDFSETLNWLRK
nr:unnamed protein product [Callosobruchus analis]